jgi:hypothetical protein
MKFLSNHMTNGVGDRCSVHFPMKFVAMLTQIVGILPSLSAAEVTPDQLLNYLSGVPEIYGADACPKKLEWMLRQAKSLAGK